MFSARASSSKRKIFLKPKNKRNRTNQWNRKNKWRNLMKQKRNRLQRIIERSRRKETKRISIIYKTWQVSLQVRDLTSEIQIQIKNPKINLSMLVLSMTLTRWRKLRFQIEAQRFQTTENTYLIHQQRMRGKRWSHKRMMTIWRVELRIDNNQ